MPATPHRISGPAAMWVVGAQIAVIYLLSTIPTPIYILYRENFHFSQVTLTVIYAVYVLGGIATMFFLGRLADQMGRRPIVLVSLAIGAISAVVFLATTNTAWLFPARILSGLAIALASGASAAWVTELEPGRDRGKATQVVIGFNLLGLGLGGLLAGLLAQWAAWPLRLPYLVFLAVLAPTAFYIWKSKETVRVRKKLSQTSMRPRLGVPSELRSRFISPAICAFAVFSVLGFYSALIPSLLNRSLHNDNHAVAGAIVAQLFIIGAIAVACTKHLKTTTGLLLALVLLIPSVGLLVLAERIHSLPTLLLGTGVAGLATGLGYRYGLQSITEIAPEDRRSEIVSTYLIACYCGISLPVVGIAFLAKATNPMLADLTFAGVVAFLSLVALIIHLPSHFRGFNPICEQRRQPDI